MSANSDYNSDTALRQLMNYNLGQLGGKEVTFEDVVEYNAKGALGRGWKWLKSSGLLRNKNIETLFHKLTRKDLQTLNIMANKVVADCFEKGHKNSDEQMVETGRKVCGVLKYTGKLGYSWLGQSYVSQEKIWNNDRSLINEKTQTLAVFDGAGHNKKNVFEREQHLYLSLTKNVWNYYGKNSSFSSLKEAANPMLEMLAKTAKIIREKLDSDMDKGISGQGPAMIIGQVIDVKKQKYLLTAQTADCCLVIKKTDGSFIWKKSVEDLGLGDFDLKTKGPNVGFIQADEVETGDEVIAFSDGVGEFLSEKEITSIINGHQPQGLGEAFKKAITSHSDRKLYKESDGYVGGFSKDRDMAVHPGKKCKVHSDFLEAKSFYDDMAISYLRVT